MSRYCVLCRDSGARCHVTTRQGVRMTNTLFRAQQALGTGDSLVPCCVMTEEALCPQQTRLGTHDRLGCAHDKGLHAP